MSEKIIHAKARFKPRTDTAANWASANPVLLKGEPGVVSDGTETEWLKIGDGVTPFLQLSWKKGPKGDTGNQGPQGPRGYQGRSIAGASLQQNGHLHLTFHNPATGQTTTQDIGNVKGDPGEDAAIDEHYSPTSDNAQSGKAVAEAVETRDITPFIDYTIDNATNEITITGLKSGVSAASLVGRFRIPDTITIDGVARTVTTIGGTCFYNCVNADFILPSTLTTIEDGTAYSKGAFSNTKITNANPNPNMYVGVGAFYGCNYISSLDIPYGVTTNNGCYMNCKNLKTVIIEEGITALASNTFAGCENIYYFKLPETLTTLGQTVFWNNHSLKKLYIPISLINVASNSFLNDVFEYIYFGGTQDEWNASTRTALRNAIQAMTGVQIFYNQRPAIMQDVINGGGGGGTVDQQYDPTSTNAQSGTAVAEAISTKVDKITDKGLSTNDYTNTDKQIVDSIDNSYNTVIHSGLTDYLDLCAEYNALMSGDSVNNIPAVKNCEPFIFFTDVHKYPYKAQSQASFREYLGQIQSIYKNTATSFVLSGGDWLESEDTPAQASAKLGVIGQTCKTMLEPCYMLVGNHDTNYQGKKDSSSAIRTTRLPIDSINNLWYGGKKAYYSFDGIKTRFYCFDTGVENQQLTEFNNYGYEQAHAFASALLNEASPHIAIALHMYLGAGTITDEVISDLTNNQYTVARHPIYMSSVFKITDSEGNIKSSDNYTVDTVTGVITSVNSGLSVGDKVTYVYYHSNVYLTKLLMRIAFAFNQRSKINFDNETYDYTQITSDSKVDCVFAGHTHEDVLLYHRYDTITLTNDVYTLPKDNVFYNSVVITSGDGLTVRTNYTVDYRAKTITNGTGSGIIQNGDIVYYDYYAYNNTAAGTNDMPVIITTKTYSGIGESANFDAVFIDYDNNVIKTIRIGAGSDRQIYIGGMTNNG